MAKTQHQKYNRDNLRDGDLLVVKMRVRRDAQGSLFIRQGGYDVEVGRLFAEGAEVLDIQHTIRVGDTVSKQGTVSLATVKALLDADGVPIDPGSAAEPVHAIIKYDNGQPHTHEVKHLTLIEPVKNAFYGYAKSYEDGPARFNAAA